MDGIFKFIMKIISIILIIIAFLILLSSLYKIGTFEDIKNLFSRDKETEQVEEIEEDTEEAEEIEIIEEIPDDGTHLIFNNVPINGTLKSYIAQMEKKGFKINGWANLTKEEIKTEAYKNGKAVMIGDFADFKQCTLYVETLTNKDLVYKIRVEFEYTSEWKELKENYTHLKQLLTKKYGTPASCTEKIKVESWRIGDNSDIMGSFNEGSKYETIFKTDKGDITLFIDTNHRLTLEYLDKKNSKLITDHALDEL